MNGRNNRTRTGIVAALGWLIALAGWGTGLDYPETRTVDQVDDYHGTTVADPYRWLEQDIRESEEVADWVERQNQVTFGYLESLEHRGVMRQRLEELWDYEKYSVPIKEAGCYFFTRNDGLQNQSVLYVQDNLDTEPRPLIDPNTWSEDGTIALAGYEASRDGRYLAYGVAEAGSDWRTWKVLDLTTGETLPDEVAWVKYSSAEWLPDGSGFFYGRYPAVEDEREKYQTLNYNYQLYFHRIRSEQKDDLLVYERPDEPEWGFFPSVTEDGRYLVITVAKGTDDRYRVFVKDLQDSIGLPKPLIDNFDHEYSFVGSDGPVLYFMTNLDAPLRRLIAIDLERPEREHWREIIPQAEATLVDVSLVGNMFIAEYLADARAEVKTFRLDGSSVREIEFPGIGSASGFEGHRGDTETFYQFSSYATPTTIYRYDLLTGESHEFRRAQVDFDPGDYEVKQVFYTSRDGTRVPMFLAHRSGLELNGTNPTLLYGYGGFDISQKPYFSVSRLAWMEMGGVLAVANLRGGGEYGEDWHKAGTKLNKQNVFDDFIAAGEWLIANGYTSAEHLGIQGGSNGGLLVGAVMTQRPDLFAAALPAVGVMDMLRFHQFTAGRFWVDDYGSAENPEEFQALYAYSPYHNLEEGVDYPATLVTTADHDDRVVPGHSFKFAARLQRAHAGEDPVLIRIDTRAGHGAGTPTSKLIDKVADQWAFLAEHTGLREPFVEAGAASQP